MSQVETHRKTSSKTFGNLIGNQEVQSDKTFESRNSSELSDVIAWDYFPKRPENRSKKRVRLPKKPLGTGLKRLRRFVVN